MNELPQKILDTTAAANDALLPSKSKDKYLKMYKQFSDWRLENNVVGV